MRRAPIAAAVAALGIAGVAAGAAAGGGADAGTADAAPGRAVSVELREWALEPEPARARAGVVDLVARNSGRIEHELVVVRTATPADRLPVGLEGVRPELVGEVVAGDLHRDHAHGSGAVRRRHIESGGERWLRARLAPGRYVLLCPLPGHYEAGQRAALVVR